MALTTVLENYITETELAKQFGCGRATIRRYCREPDGLEHQIVGGKKMFDKRDIDAWLERRKKRPNPTRKAKK